MEDVEGRLCDMCVSVIPYEDYSNMTSGSFDKRYQKQHHQNYNDLTAKEGKNYEHQEIKIDFRIEPHDLYSEWALGTKFHIRNLWTNSLEIPIYMGPLKLLTRENSAPISSQDLLHDLEAHPWATLTPNIGGDESLVKIRQWISFCRTNHKFCHSNHRRHELSVLEPGAFFPTRVLDVEEADIGKITLRSRKEVLVQFDTDRKVRQPTSDESGAVHEHPVYWTLSHRWGDADEMPRLLKDTETQLHEGVGLHELSPINKAWPTFLDAALLVKRLGYRYLWVDSLCIRQDSEEDWQREACSMIDVYRHSHCNISATYASYDPANNGIFRRRKICERHLYPFVVNIAGQQWWVWSALAWYDLEEAPLNKRGWVAQERFLPTGTLYFTEYRVLWECEEDGSDEPQLAGDATPLENLTRLKRYLVGGNNIARDYKMAALDFGKVKGTPTRESLRKIYSYWCPMLSYYASCGLTKESDRLVAISGVAKDFQEVTNDTYLAGLWKDMLSYWLAWYITSRSEDQFKRNKFAPSWSWASIAGGELAFPCLHENSISYIKLIKARIEPESPEGDSFGQLRSAELEIESTCFFLGILFAMFPYDFPLLWTKDPISATYLDQLEIHLKFMHQSPPLIARILSIMVGVGFLGFFIKLFRASESNMLFDGASLVLYLIGVGVYVANIVKGLRLVSAGAWNENSAADFDPTTVGVGRPGVGGGDPLTGGEIILGREDSLKVLAASNTILALVLVGVLVLQAGQWYAERKDDEEFEKYEKMEKTGNGGRPSSPTAEKNKKKQ
ncbi:ER membrane protein SH3-domain-containing protein [Daldinia sp. FL1419]|nr:ER membrane protein SH3-domain-containing protein [Daldinia sp. FL1419]